MGGGDLLLVFSSVLAVSFCKVLVAAGDLLLVIFPLVLAVSFDKALVAFGDLLLDVSLGGLGIYLSGLNPSLSIFSEHALSSSE